MDHASPVDSALISAVRQHAVEHYNEGGWDYLVECYSDEDIAREIGDASSVKEAVSRIQKSLDLKNDVREDVRGYGGLYD